MIPTSSNYFIGSCNIIWVRWIPVRTCQHNTQEIVCQLSWTQFVYFTSKMRELKKWISVVSRSEFPLRKALVPALGNESFADHWYMFFHYVLFLIKRWVCVMNKLSKINYFFVKSSQNSSYFILVEPLSKSKVRFLMRIMWTFMVFGLITLYFCCNFLKTELWVEGWDWICIGRAAERTIRGFWNYLVTGFLGNKHILRIH